MRYGLIALIVAVLGIGEYAFVEYYPLTLQRRVAKFEKLPIVRAIVKAENIRRVDELIAESDEGIVSVTRDGVAKTWESGSQWHDDFEAGDWHARNLFNQIEDRALHAEHADSWRKKAVSGDVGAMFQLWVFGRENPESGDAELAAELLERHDSALAEFYQKIWITKDFEMGSRDGMLLMARVARENYRVSYMDDEAYRESSAHNERSLRMLRQAAADGGEDAIWVMEQLNRESAP